MRCCPVFLLLTLLLGLGLGQAPVFTTPSPDGSTVIVLRENVPLATSILLVVTSQSSDVITLLSVTDVSSGNSKSSDIELVGTNQLRTKASLDYEAGTKAYKVTLQAVNAASLTSSATFIVTVNDVNDESPVMAVTSDNINFQEEQAAGTAVPFGITASDADSGDKLTFSLSGSQASYFGIDSSTGDVIVTQRLDRDAGGAMTVFNQLTVTVTDAAGHSATHALQVTLTDINDNSPTCSPSVIAVSVNENTGAGTTVATLTCSDIDSSSNGAISTYVIFSGDDTSTKFSMSGASVKTTTTAVDYETKTSYTLVIHVTDSGTPSKTGTATVVVTVIGVNEAVPVWGVFTPAGPAYHLAESVSVGTSVLTVTATDSDSGVDGQIDYLLVSTATNSGSSVSGIFTLSAASGQLSTLTSLDREGGVSHYTVLLTAKDRGTPSKSVTTTLTINIDDVNDNAPTFASASYSVSLSESTAASAGTSVLQLTATDADPTTGSLIYQVASGDTLGKFRFSATTSGLLELNSNIEVDKPTANSHIYILVVKVNDQGVPSTPVLTGTTTVTVTISPENDNSPTFGTISPASVTTAEDAALGTTVVTVLASDKDVDSGVQQTVTLAILSGNTNNAFSIDPVTGAVVTVKTLDYETTTTYTLVITATDNGTPTPRTSTTTLTIAVINVNEKAPACSSYLITAPVDENAVTQVAALSCSDTDAGDTVTYSLVPAQASFSVNIGTGAVSTIVGLDYESGTSHTLTVHVTDWLTPVHTTTVTVSVLVRPVNEFSPVFSPSTYTAALPEDAASGTSVTTVTATDADQGSLDGTVRYSIVSGNGAGRFIINSSTGQILTSTVGLDRETTAVHTLTVRASDDVAGAATQRSADVTVVVTVTDVNDNPPICTPGSYQASVAEPSVVGATVTTLTSTDDDEAGTINTTPTYTITAGDSAAVFTINGNQVQLAKVVDYETQTSYSLTVRVTDGGTPTLSSTCVVDVKIISVNEFAPVMSVPNYSTNLLETTAVGTVVYHTNATDNDVGKGSTVTYIISAGNTNDDFFCYSTTGNILVWNSLDYDTPPQNYNLTVTATDEGGLTGSMWLYIALVDVNDQTPVFTRNIYAVAMEENVVLGTSVARVTAVDSDTGPGGQVNYTAVSGNGMLLFQVNPGTGDVTTSGSVNREVRGRYTLVVRATDGGAPALSSSCLVDITVNDLNDNAPIFSPADFVVSLSEGATVGTSVTSVAATDADASASNNVFSYVLIDNVFQVDATTRVVSTKRTLDRETTSQYVLYVLAVDSGAPSLTGTATVTVVLDDVNDNTPTINGTYDLRFREDTATKTIITTVQASDSDSGDNARLTYSIVSGNTDSDFFLDSSSGVIQVQNQLDHERTSRYFLIIAVADNGSPALTATTTITFSVSDVNDNSPVWSSTSYTFSVTENQPAGSSVGQVTATDADIGVNAALTYTLTLFWTGSSANFNLDPATGTITTAVLLDRESSAQYSALVRVVDGGSPQLSALANVTIAIGDLNDNVPTFDSVSYTATTTENDPVGTGILTLVVTDKDIGSNANITLFIDTSTTAGTRAAQFLQVTSGTGVISVKSAINRETDSSFTLTVIATDGGSPTLTSSANVTITVTDQNDNVPVFTQTYHNTEIAYTGQCSRSVVTVSARDADTGANGDVTYYLVQSSYDYLFQVDSATGLLSQRTTAGAGSVYTMQVTARDGGSPTRSATTPATIRIDAMIPNDVVITFNLGITATAFQASQEEFVAQCQALVRQTYPTAVARLWCSEAGSNSLAKVHVYFLRDNTTESVANINAAKYYIDSSTALNFFTTDPNGSPSSALSGTQWAAYNVKTVQLYYESQTPWQQTGEGIAVITTCCVLGAVLLASSAYMAITYCRQASTPRPRAQKISVEERRPPPRRQKRPRPSLPPSYQSSAPQGRPPRPIMDGDNGFFWDKSSVS